MCKHFLIVIFFFNSIASYSQDQSCDTKAEIVGFDNLKCGDCWGWYIKIDDDTIKNRSIGKQLGYQPFYPLQVYITVGDFLVEETNDFPYYNIDCIYIPCINTEMAKELEKSFCYSILDIVCGCDGKEYGNSCEARKAGVNIVRKGNCD